jgi:hypothetical protein
MACLKTSPSQLPLPLVSADQAVRAVIVLDCGDLAIPVGEAELK